MDVYVCIWYREREERRERMIVEDLLSLTILSTTFLEEMVVYQLISFSLNQLMAMNYAPIFRICNTSFGSIVIEREKSKGKRREREALREEGGARRKEWHLISLWVLPPFWG